MAEQVMTSFLAVIITINYSDFQSYKVHLSPLIACDEGVAAWGDYDNNGTLDLLLSGEAKVTRSSLTLDGVNDYGSIPNSDKINFNTNDNFSVETWVKADPNQPDQQNKTYFDNQILEKWNGLVHCGVSE
ncbi:hypothetical protein [Dolichospermum flos-aquae]|uniref:hypothetical protein n=2 Tax=Nostocales TaxID=1161 RepID=UPI00197AB361|nr:hypothetical protein [Dolichospermum flos-aquae]MBO1066004.1 hypothetical protein [Anabaena sp. 54]